MATPPVIGGKNLELGDKTVREGFIKDFDGFAPGVLGHGAGKGKEIIQLERRVSSLHTSMKAMRPPACVVVNMNPFPLTLADTLHDGMVVPPCPDDREYTYYVIPHYAVAVKDKGEADFEPEAVPPMMLAYDFENVYGGSDGYGGVFYFPGTPDMLENPKTRVSRLVDAQGNLEEITIGELMERARARQDIVCEQLFTEAENEYNRPNGQRNIITERHKRAAIVRLRRGHIAEKPPWMSLTRKEANLGIKCPSCAKQLQNNVVKCEACSYIVDMERAWDLALVERDNPQLRRLGPERLIALGFSDDDVKWLCPGVDLDKAKDGASKLTEKAEKAEKKSKAAAEGKDK